jgi:hypothetical protein
MSQVANLRLHPNKIQIQNPRQESINTANSSPITHKPITYRPRQSSASTRSRFIHKDTAAFVKLAVPLIDLGNQEISIMEQVKQVKQHNECKQ